MKADSTDSTFAVDSQIADQIRLFKVTDDTARNMVMNLRFTGYEGAFQSKEDSWDQFDRCEHTHVLLALDMNGEAIGTIRILDGRFGPLEVDNFTNGNYVSSFEPKTTFLESSRLVVSKTSSIPRRTVQAALWKSVHRYAYAYQLHQLIAWVKPGPDKAYKFLKFDRIDGLSFTHPSLANKRHEVYALDITRSEESFRSSNHPLWRFFFLDRHENLIWY